MNKILAMAFTFLCTTATAFAQTPFTDPRDGKEYKAVIIGDQTWMAENLNYEAEGSKCYDNDPVNCAKYGRLYNWETAKKICHKGWHLPSENEWKALDKALGVDLNAAGSVYVAGKELAEKKLKAKSGWDKGNGTDDYGFSALPGGYGLSDGKFGFAGKVGHWWTKDRYRTINQSYWPDDYLKSLLFSVRCIKD